MSLCPEGGVSYDEGLCLEGWVSYHEGPCPEGRGVSYYEGICPEGSGSLSRWDHCSEGVSVQGVPFQCESVKSSICSEEVSTQRVVSVQRGGVFLSRWEVGLCPEGGPPGQNDTCL